MEHIEYQLEEKMGDGKWSRVYETKKESGWSDPDQLGYKTFPSAELAKKYANEDTQRWSKGALDRGVVRVVVVRTSVTPLVEGPPPKKKDGSRHYYAEDAFFAATYPDSLYDVRLFLTGDGRKRGLWVCLEEDWKARSEQDWRLFSEGLKKFKAWLDDPKKGYAKEPDMLGFMLRSIHFSYFFEHRTEARAIRLSWRKSLKLAEALKKAHADEKKKTLDDYDDLYGEDPEDD